MSVIETWLQASVLLVAGLLVVFPASRASIWADLDRFAYLFLRYLSRHLKIPLNIGTKQWDDTRPDRVSIIRLGLIGMLLVFVFPLHAFFGTDNLVDYVWSPISYFQNAVAQLWGNSKSTFTQSDWRDDGYLLWEVCVFLWTVLMFGVYQRRELRSLFRHSTNPSNSANVFDIAQLYTVMLLLIFSGGLFLMLLVEVSVAKIAFEIAVLIVLCAMEAYIARGHQLEGAPVRARQALSILFFVELPALLAFIVVLLFILSNGLYLYPSHWSHPFAAGASALSLMVANLAMLSMRVRHSVET